jgi:hypothetical protein
VGTLRKSMVVLNLDVKAQKATLLKTISLDVGEVESAFIFKSADGRTFVAVSSGNLLHAAPLGKLGEAIETCIYMHMSLLLRVHLSTTVCIFIINSFSLLLFFFVQLVRNLS